MDTTLSDATRDAGEDVRRSRVFVDEEPQRWVLAADEARDGARGRRAFRTYLERHGHPSSDFDAAEAVYGELVNTCVDHAPGKITIEFTWDDRKLAVVDSRDRLRSWPFSPEHFSTESTHHAYTVISTFTERVHVTRDPSGGTRASVVLPVRRAEG